MSNVHAPERQQGESFTDYKLRRVASRKAVASITGHGLTGGTTSREQQRNSARASGAMSLRTRAYKALMNAWAARRITKDHPRDDHGAVTLVGPRYELENVMPTSREFVLSAGVDGPNSFHTVRRIWLGGISEQRGF